MDKYAQAKEDFKAMKEQFFEAQNLAEKLSIAKKGFWLVYVQEAECDELATLAEIIMRRCAPEKDDRLYAEAADFKKVCEKTARYWDRISNQ